MEVKGKHFLVAGLGKSGKALIEVIRSLDGYVSVYDDKKEEELVDELKRFIKNYEAKPFLGEIPGDDVLKSFEMVVLSPGIPLTHELVQNAERLGVKVIGELEFAYKITSAKFVAITGTNGKTTTTSLVGEIFKNAGFKTKVVGNIGIPVVLEAVDATPDTWLVTEVSSFQLETTYEFKPVISTILNLSVDHLNRHKTMENYGNIKTRVCMNQDKSDYFVVNADDEKSYELVNKCENAQIVSFSKDKKTRMSATLIHGKLYIIQDDKKIPLCRKEEVRIKGEHNLENALAAAMIAFCAGVDTDIIAQTLREFKGVEHRLEYVTTIDGVHFVNDSKGTNPDSTIKAIHAMEKNIILIAGGSNKDSDYTDLVKLLNGRVKYLILQGDTAKAIAESAKSEGFENIKFSTGMEESVKTAFALAEPDDVVLLSPACASFDFYLNFEERGKDFKSKVFDLKK